MSEQIQDGPPGPDDATSPDESYEADVEIIEVDDNYKRRNNEAKLASLINDQFGETIIDASKYTDEYWTKREQDLANEGAKNAARVERERMRHRAELLVSTSSQVSSACCGFPRWAVDGAQATTIDTPAMKHSRKFVHALQRELTAGTQRILGERDPDDDGRPAARILVLAGGTGAGKTTAAAWIGLKSTDLLPGFIRASELERRGRYDKEFRTWLPERTSLVIDDLGAELLDGKSVFRSFLDEIVDAFYSSKRSLILTTNLRGKIDDDYRAKCKAENPPREPEPQFKERYGDRVRSRVVQIGEWAECGNTDLREIAR